MSASPPVARIREVELRYVGRGRPAPERIRDPIQAAKHARMRIGDRTRECFLAIYLDTQHRPLGDQIVHIGAHDEAFVHPREVFRPAVLLGAVGVIVAHNHPSGNLQPSNEDRALTERLIQAGKILGITLLDSLVVTLDGHACIRP